MSEWKCPICRYDKYESIRIYYPSYILYSCFKCSAVFRDLEKFHNDRVSIVTDYLAQ